MTLFIYYIIACAFSTALASALHGGDYYSKGYIIAVHCILFPLSAPLFWGFLRGSKQARAELDLIAGDDFAAVEKAYYVKPLGKLMVKVMKYCKENPWPEFGAAPTRRQQELCGGFVLGAICSLPALLIMALWGV
jgi:hypothetical protein